LFALFKITNIILLIIVTIFVIDRNLIKILRIRHVAKATA